MALKVVLTDKDWKMFKDDNYFDVTHQDVKNLLYRMACSQMPRRDIVRMRIKYDAWIDDPEKKFMTALGLNYDTHDVIKDPLTRSFRVNGFTEKQWRMLNDDDYVPNIKGLLALMTRCESTGNFEAVDILSEKYCDMLQNREQRIFSKNKIPPDAEYESLTYKSIDGLPFLWWRLLNEEGMTPPHREKLLSIIESLREAGQAEAAEGIEQKYLTYLYPELAKPKNQKAIAAAREFLRANYPYSFKDED